MNRCHVVEIVSDRVCQRQRFFSCLSSESGNLLQALSGEALSPRQTTQTSEFLGGLRMRHDYSLPLSKNENKPQCMVI